MIITYDFHIHTALSPCGEESMTPNNIVNMALLNGLDAIAITDHNSCENVEVVMKVAQDKELIVIPGIEVETKEEIHVVCLFYRLEDVYNVQEIIYSHLPQIKNKEKIFGKQLVFNEEDDVIRELDKMLSFATSLSIDKVYDLVRLNSGIMIPAHIDRPSYSILSNLGMLPSNLDLPTLEVSRHCDYESYIKKYPKHRLLRSSDAHELGYIGICESQLSVQERSIKSILDCLKQMP